MRNSPPPATLWVTQNESVFERLWLHNHLTRNFASVSISFSPRKMVWKVNLEKIFIGPCWNVSSQVNRILKGGWWFPPIFPNLPQSSLEILKGFPVTPLPLNTPTLRTLQQVLCSSQPFGERQYAPTRRPVATTLAPGRRAKLTRLYSVRCLSGCHIWGTS